jgi:hypothetical protein
MDDYRCCEDGNHPSTNQDEHSLGYDVEITNGRYTSQKPDMYATAAILRLSKRDNSGTMHLTTKCDMHHSRMGDA